MDESSPNAEFWSHDGRWLVVSTYLHLSPVEWVVQFFLQIFVFAIYGLILWDILCPESYLMEL